MHAESMIGREHSEPSDAELIANVRAGDQATYGLAPSTRRHEGNEPTGGS
jgi:hypothetical protein